jgi:hypothetical protein
LNHDKTLDLLEVACRKSWIVRWDLQDVYKIIDEFIWRLHEEVEKLALCAFPELVVIVSDVVPNSLK